jgi:tetratricopeptide (TPR) repeat protein
MQSLAADSAAQRFRAGLAYERLGRLEDAYTELQLGAVLAPDDPLMALALGTVALRLSRYDVAQRALETSISVDARSIASYYQLALLYEKQNVPERAIDSWHRFIDLNQDEVLKGMAKKHLRLLETRP